MQDVRIFSQPFVGLENQDDSLRKLEERVNLSISVATCSGSRQVQSVSYSISHLIDDNYVHTVSVLLQER